MVEAIELGEVKMASDVLSPLMAGVRRNQELSVNCISQNGALDKAVGVGYKAPTLQTITLQTSHKTPATMADKENNSETITHCTDSITDSLTDRGNCYRI